MRSQKGGKQFPHAVSAFEDEQALTVADDVDEEQRWMTIGLDGMGRILVVAYTWRGQRVRIISARQATRREREQYEENS